MAAICGAVLPFVRAGDRIVAVDHLYSDAYRLFETVLARFGVETTYVDGRETEALIDALPGARLVYLESPTSWTFQVQDICAIAEAARRHGVLSVIDNSWATPVFQLPATLGVDLIVHAASKYLSGHSDTLGGLVAGPRALIQRIDHEATHLFGGRMAPMDAFLVLRGMRTLELRMRRHMESGLAIARMLSLHSGGDGRASSRSARHATRRADRLRRPLRLRSRRGGGCRTLLRHAPAHPDRGELGWTGEA